MDIRKTDYQSIVLGINNLNTLISDLGAAKAMIVADASLPFLNIRDSIESIPIPHVVFSQFSPNPLYEDVCQGVELFNREHCDLLVAVGGGSSIDVAKCIKLYCKMDATKNYLHQECADSGIPLIAIPTTAGTGSESTRFAVIYYQGKKQSVNHLSIIPNFALLEPSVLTTLPSYQKKCTVLDALCQGIESWWSINATEESRRISQAAVATLIDIIVPYVEGTGHSDQDLLIATRVMHGANLAGQAINITQTTAPHAFSYKITSLYHLPHGHAVAVCLPTIWKHMIAHTGECVAPEGREQLEQTFSKIAAALHCSTPTEGVACLEQMLERLELDYPMPQNREEELATLASSVNPVRLKNNPIPLDLDTIASLYNQIIKP